MIDRWERIQEHLSNHSGLDSIAVIAIGFFIVLISFGPYVIRWFFQVFFQPGQEDRYGISAELENPGLVIETDSRQGRTWMRKVLGLGRPGDSEIVFDSVEHDGDVSRFKFKAKEDDDAEIQRE